MTMNALSDLISTNFTPFSLLFVVLLFFDADKKRGAWNATK